MSTAISLNRPALNIKGQRAVMLKIKKEDMEIVVKLEELKVTLDYLHNMFDNITDPLLIDSCIYEMQAANIRYKYYLNQCKGREVTAAAF
jgi:hypothetical protein